MPDYTIRPARQQDIGAVIELCEEHAMFEGCEYDKTDKADKLSNHFFKEIASVKCVVVETAEGIKGYATFIHEFSTWDAAYYMHMDCLYLNLELRGKGIGRKIIELIYSDAKLAGYVNVQWQTPNNNYDAIKFYKKIGARAKDKVRFYLNCSNKKNG